MTHVDKKERLEEMLCVGERERERETMKGYWEEK